MTVAIQEARLDQILVRQSVLNDMQIGPDRHFIQHDSHLDVARQFGILKIIL